jgi:hypothetical protein
MLNRSVIAGMPVMVKNIYLCQIVHQRNYTALLGLLLTWLPVHSYA